MDEVTDLIKKAVWKAVPADQFVQRRLRPGSDYSWQEPAPLAGLQAALAVVRIAQQQAHEFAIGLRREGSSWEQIADLLQVEWVDGRSRDELAYELVLGPEPEGRTSYYTRNVYWHCHGPQGCGKYITDHGPYNGSPRDNEDGHAEDCGRHAAEIAAYREQMDLEEQRYIVREETMAALPAGFGRETVQRARYVLSHGGRYLGWSTSETLAVALVLGHDDVLARHGWSDPERALDRVLQGTREPVEGREQWLATLRAAATGELTPPA